jgi:hypothetical protein
MSDETKKDDGGPAFPQVSKCEQERVSCHDGRECPALRAKVEELKRQLAKDLAASLARESALEHRIDEVTSMLRGTEQSRHEAAHRAADFQRQLAEKLAADPRPEPPRPYATERAYLIADKAGRLADRIDNCIHSLLLPMPDALHLKALREILPQLLDEARALATMLVELSKR